MDGFQTVPAAHWLQLEKPDEVNAIMREWLAEWYPPSSSSGKEDETKAHRDEL